MPRGVKSFITRPRMV